jgi:hypothetical protein
MIATTRFHGHGGFDGVVEFGEECAGYQLTIEIHDDQIPTDGSGGEADVNRCNGITIPVEFFIEIFLLLSCREQRNLIFEYEGDGVDVVFRSYRKGGGAPFLPSWQVKAPVYFSTSAFFSFGG